ncbi:tegument protein G75 [Common bottlenose dolphin gammaherpesvirus 1 strain Sarasota]|uniref:Tegument protein G75 n=1 Tax=Common bottlenose dolphin gammaherpesvirus 1 strain Sarasota TaxID=2022783 RepID=A0A1Z1NE53_9GAMA|nr:tegument protein G75 [Common bottlenose dolphin gammaherpesvirus 1 strain Sarasota]ARW78136.1 tegument protein G75 [Common bottlenose dolphin gammaherpesvirus 1 strain Sarasota]
MAYITPNPSDGQGLTEFRAHISYSNANYTPDEERAVFEFMDRRGPFTIRSGTIVTENVTIIILGPSRSDHTHREDTEVAVVRHLLSDALEYNKSHPRSDAMTPGPHTLTLVYGPNLKWRNTTTSIELQDLLAILKCKWIRRVELCRSFSCKVMQYLLDEEFNPVTSIVLNHSGLVQYRDIARDALKVSPKDWSMPFACSDNAVALLDPINTLVMTTTSPDEKTIAAKTMLDTRGMAFDNKILTPSTITRWSTVCPFQPTSYITEGITNVYGNLSFFKQQLECLRYQKGVFPSSQVLAAFVGLYVPAPLKREQGSDLLSHKQIHYHLRTQNQAFAGCHLPTIGGFLNRISTEMCAITIERPLVYTCHLATTDKNETYSTRYVHPQYLVCLGPFVPSVTNDIFPFQYSESAVHFNKIQQVLDTVNQIMGMPIISRSERVSASGPVAAHLFKLLQGTGATIFMSTLPRFVTRRISNSAAEQKAAIYSQFLLIHSAALFLIVKNNKAINKQSGVDFPLNIFRKAAELAQCPFAVIGITQRAGGLHFVDDLDDPQDVAKIPPNKQFHPAFSVSYDDYLRQVQQQPLDEPDLIAVPLSKPASLIDWNAFPLESSVAQIFQHPSVGSKEFIVRHVNRCGNGLIAQQPGVGPLDLPLADYGLIFDSALWPMASLNDQGELVTQPPQSAKIWREITHGNFHSKTHTYPSSSFHGHAMSLGEQALKVQLHHVSGAKLAITEAMTNLMFAPHTTLPNVTLSMSVTWNNGPDSREEIEKVLNECKAFAESMGPAITVTSASCSCPRGGSDTYSTLKSIVVSACARVSNGPRVTPELRQAGSWLVLVAIDNKPWISGSTFEHVIETHAGTIPSPCPKKVAALFSTVQSLVAQGVVLSGHDISDGGTVTCLLEMALAGNRGIKVYIPGHLHAQQTMFSETPGAILEVSERSLESVQALCSRHGLYYMPIGRVGEVGQNQPVIIYQGKTTLFQQTLGLVYSSWSSFSQQQYDHFRNEIQDGALYINDYGDNEIRLGALENQLKEKYACMYTQPDLRFQVAVLSPPGPGKETSMLSALTNAGFTVYRINITEIKGINVLDQFIGIMVSQTTGHKDNITGAKGIALACFKSDILRGALTRFFSRKHTFSLACGELGFELFKTLGVIGPTGSGAIEHNALEIEDHGIELEANASKLYESRWANFYIHRDSKAEMLRPLQGAIIPCWVQGTHTGLRYKKDKVEYNLRSAGLVACSYHGKSVSEDDYAKNYPRNPTVTSTVAGICSPNGRHLALTFDPSLAFHMWQWQHVPASHKDLKVSPWSLMFYHMHIWCNETIPT